MEIALEQCIAMPYIHVHKRNRKFVVRAYSFAFVCHKASAPQWARQGGENLIAKEANGDLWVTLAESNICTILGELARGKGTGKMVMRAFWYSPELGRARRR